MGKLNCSKVASTALISMLASTSLISPVAAQSLPLRKQVDQNGVDLISGQYTFSKPLLRIGEGPGELRFDQIWAPGWRHNYMATLWDDGEGITISAGELSETFELNEQGYVSAQLTGASLVGSDFGQYYNYTASDGTIIKFKKVQGDWGYLFYNWTTDIYNYLATEIIKPSGEKISLAYQVENYRTQYDETIARTRLQSVTNNFGYQLKFEYFPLCGQLPANPNGSVKFTGSFPTYPYIFIPQYQARDNRRRRRFLRAPTRLSPLSPFGKARASAFLYSMIWIFHRSIRILEIDDRLSPKLPGTAGGVPRAGGCH